VTGAARIPARVDEVAVEPRAWRCVGCNNKCAIPEFVIIGRAYNPSSKIPEDPLSPNNNYPNYRSTGQSFSGDDCLASCSEIGYGFGYRNKGGCEPPLNVRSIMKVRDEEVIYQNTSPSGRDMRLLKEGSLGAPSGACGGCDNNARQFGRNNCVSLKFARRAALGKLLARARVIIQSGKLCANGCYVGKAARAAADRQAAGNT